MEIADVSILKQLKRNIEVSVDKILNNCTELADEKQLTDAQFDTIVENISKCKEIQVITQKFFKDYKSQDSKNQNFIVSLDKNDMYDDNALDKLYLKLNQNKSTDLKLCALQTLLKYPIIELVDKYKWPKFMKVLSECLTSKNKDVAQSSFKIHIKLSSHQQSIICASLNLVKTLAIVFQTRQIQMFWGIDLKNGIQDNILQITHLLLTNFKNIHRHYNKDKLMETLIINFMELFMSHLNCNEKNDYVYFLHYLSILDPKANWFQYLTFNVPNRKIVLNFCFKHSAFLKELIEEIISIINITEFELIFKKCRTEINMEIIKMATLSHCINIICALLSFRCSTKLFPIEVRLNEKPVNIHLLVIIMVTSLNNLNSTSKQKPKRDILSGAITNILIKNRHLLHNKELVYVLFKPIMFKVYEKQRIIDVAKKNAHVFHIISAITNTKDGFFILFGNNDSPSLKTSKKSKSVTYIQHVSLPDQLIPSRFIEKSTSKQQQSSYSATDRNNASIAKLVVEFTSNVLRFVNLYEKLTSIDNIVYELMDCCCNLYSCHSHTIYLVNSQKLTLATIHLYRTLIDRNLLSKSINSLIKFLMFICCTKNGIQYFLKEDADLLYLFCKECFSIPNVSIWKQANFHKFIIGITCTEPGCEAILESRKSLIQLNNIWELEEDENAYVTGSDRKLKMEIFEYMKIIFTIHLSYNCARTLLSYEDDESTLVESEKNLNSLQDLVDYCLDSSGPGTLQCYIGLLTIRMLSNNLNILIFLEHTKNLKSLLTNLQNECVIENDNELEVILDECSMLRKKIINYIDCVGNINPDVEEIYSSQKKTSSLVRNRRPGLNELQKFLNESKNHLHDFTWLTQARKVYKQLLNGSNLKDSFFELIQQVRLTVPNTKNYFIWPENDNNLIELFPEDLIGINMIVDFGNANKILYPPAPYTDVLATLLKQVQSFLNLRYERFEGFDWFVGVVFLICSGNLEKCKIVLQCLVHLPIAPYIWPNLRRQYSAKKKFNYSVQFDHILNILIEDFEIFKPALENACISWPGISSIWLNQCFFNILEWHELCNFMVLAILFPPEYVLYYFMTCAMYLEPKLINVTLSHDVTAYHNIIQLQGYSITEWFNSIESMGKQYKNILSKF